MSEAPGPAPDAAAQAGDRPAAAPSTPTSSATGERLAFFGGTFDPPHHGHIAVARAAAAAFGLQRVLLAPVGNQPLKRMRQTSSFADRLAMVRLACAAANPPGSAALLEASTLDEPLPGGTPNFTIDTLCRLSASLPASPPSHLHVIVGADSFMQLRLWRSPDELLAAATWIVVSRPGFSLDDLHTLGLTPAQLAGVRLLPGVEVPISATALRAALARGDDVSAALDPGVLAYIREHGLYQPPTGPHNSIPPGS